MVQTIIKSKITTLIVATVFALTIVLSFGLQANAMKPSKGNTIVATALAANAPGGAFEGQLDTLISAVVNLGLVDTLSGNRPYTVFAPTDDAFAAINLSPASFVGLNDEQKAAYTDIVLYHVTNGKRNSASVLGASQIRMANGDFAAINGATIDGAPIIATDVKASNGVIHAVSSVLLP